MTTFVMTIGLTIGIVGIALAQSNKNVPQTKIIMIINAPIDSAFNYIVPVNLSHIFKRYKSLPAITKTDEAEKWIKAGLTRKVYFEDGSTSKETLLTVVPHSSFSYKIENFTSQLRFLAKRIEGDWIFTNLGSGQTRIEWTYKVVPKNFFARGLINLVLLKNIKGLLTNALTILKNDLEKSGRKKGQQVTAVLRQRGVTQRSINSNNATLIQLRLTEYIWAFEKVLYISSAIGFSSGATEQRMPHRTPSR